MQEEYPLTLEEAAAILQLNNNAIKISRNTVESAKARKQQLGSAWFPTIVATGGYMHFSNNISADANVGELTQSIAGNLPESIKGLEQIILCAMEKNPRNRYQSAAQMLRHLRRLKMDEKTIFNIMG